MMQYISLVVFIMVLNINYMVEAYTSEVKFADHGSRYLWIRTYEAKHALKYHRNLWWEMYNYVQFFSPGNDVCRFPDILKDMLLNKSSYLDSDLPCFFSSMFNLQ